MGLIDAAACPHYDGEVERRPTYHRSIQNGLQWGYAAEDGAALYFRGAELSDVVTSRSGAAAYRVEMVDGKIEETRLESRYLGKSM
ncbi:MAG: hypothetical protein R3F19_19230 [Verrucomicrobiales bacterium]